VNLIRSAAFTDKTKVVIINTPHNPSGKVFSREELTAIAEICTKHDVLVLADEVVGYKIRIQQQGRAS
jgi:N-succinyldiaminopimelate aminotransferase